VPKGTSLPEQKYPVPKDNFGPCALSPDGKSVIVTSTGGNTFLAKVEAKEEKETSSVQGGGDSGGAGGSGGSGGSQGGGSEGGQQGQSGGKKPEISIKAVDFFFGSKIDSIVFSPDGKMFIA
jgi:hypothetical protein